MNDHDTKPAPPPAMTVPPVFIAQAAVPTEFSKPLRSRAPVWIAVVGAVAFGSVAAVAVAKHVEADSADPEPEVAPAPSPEPATTAASASPAPASSPESSASPAFAAAPQSGASPATGAPRPAGASSGASSVVAVAAHAEVDPRASGSGGRRLAAPSPGVVHAGNVERARSGGPSFRQGARSPGSAAHRRVRHRLTQPGFDERSGSDDVAAAIPGMPEFGELQPRDVRAIVARRRPRMRQCYDTALRRHGAPEEVSVVVTVSVDPLGQVTAVDVAGRDLGSLHRCLQGVAAQMHFPASFSGGVVPVRLHFSPQTD